jgi:hypothetical protein
VTEAPRSVPPSLRRGAIRVGELLAEGGEGRVFELPLHPHLVFKEYRQRADHAHLEDLVGWPKSGESDLTGRVRSSTSWPASVVERGGSSGGSSRDAIGVLVARAPRRFSVRHRDGSTRLATLSYLTADPAYREVAYGLSLPASFGAERLGLVYALARVLEAFDRLEPRVGHGDLSSKNVLWSLQRGPEVFLIDCDNCERYGADGRPLSVEGRRRAMTPNWDDPAVPPGANPALTSDRYSLALIFLRVVGAANFPVQARQRQGGSISIDFPIPPGFAGEVLLGPASPLWALCARGLSTELPDSRPAPTEWVAALEAVLDGLGAAAVLHSVWSAQGGGPVGTPVHPPRVSAGTYVPEDAATDVPTDVTVRPVVASVRHPRPARLVGRTASTRPSGGFAGWSTSGGTSPLPNTPAAARLSSSAPAPPTRQTATTAGSAPAEPVIGQVSAGLRMALQWWLDAHRSLVRGLAGPRRGGAGENVQRLALCAAVDLAVATFGLFLVAMAVAPFLGI